MCVCVYLCVYPHLARPCACVYRYASCDAPLGYLVVSLARSWEPNFSTSSTFFSVFLDDASTSGVTLIFVSVFMPSFLLFHFLADGAPCTFLEFASFEGAKARGCRRCRCASVQRVWNRSFLLCSSRLGEYLPRCRWVLSGVRQDTEEDSSDKWTLRNRVSRLFGFLLALGLRSGFRVLKHRNTSRNWSPRFGGYDGDPMTAKFSFSAAVVKLSRGAFRGMPVST